MVKYRRWYDSLIERARRRNLDGYCERHHVTPRALGGHNGEIVRLTYREHFLAHWLLTKFTTGYERRKMLYALQRMAHCKGGQSYVASWQYAVAKRANRDASMGNKYAVGKSHPHTPEFKAALSARNKGNTFGAKKPPGFGEGQRQALLGKRHTPERIANIKAAQQARRQKEEADGLLKLSPKVMRQRERRAQFRATGG
jgi:hypothetical protein